MPLRRPRHLGLLLAALLAAAPCIQPSLAQLNATVPDAGSAGGLDIGLDDGGDEARIRMSLMEKWTNLFAGQETILHVMIHTRSSFSGTLIWRFSSGENTIATDRQIVKAKAFAPVNIELRLPVPALKSAASAQAALSLTLQEDEITTPAATLEQPFVVFHPNPFQLRAAWLRGLQLSVFDPSGATTARLTAMDIPFSVIQDVDLAANPIQGILIIGEGLALADYSSIFDSLVRLADAGISSICLAPLNGEIALPGMGDVNLPKPATIVFRDRNILREFDRRLDVAAWPQDGDMEAMRLRLSGEQGAVIGKIQELGDGWPWMEMAYGEGKGTIFLCGFSIIGKWDATPAPRFLLMRMLERLQKLPAPPGGTNTVTAPQ